MTSINVKNNLNNKLISEIEISKENKNIPSEKLIMTFDEIIELILSKPNYLKQKVVKEHHLLLKQQALYDCIRLWENINLDRNDNVYAYMIQIIKCSFSKIIMKVARSKNKRN